MLKFINVKVTHLIQFQLVNIRDHLEQAKRDIMTRIPDPDYNGLVVIDWEPWRPLWERNWMAKKIYKIKSIELVRQRHADWPMTDLVLEAKDEFETAARAMFEQTIRLGKRLRPKALWGFYGFPDCFGQEQHDFQCTDEVKLFLSLFKGYFLPNLFIPKYSMIVKLDGARSFSSVAQ